MSDAATETDTDGPVYMVVAGDTVDPVRMGEYSRALLSSGLYEKARGYYINHARPIEVFQGDPSPSFATLIVRFPSLSAARAFWWSDTYQNDIAPLRKNPDAGLYTVTVYREADLPPYMAGQVDAAAYAEPR